MRRSPSGWGTFGSEGKTKTGRRRSLVSGVGRKREPVGGYATLALCPRKEKHETSSSAQGISTSDFATPKHRHSMSSALNSPVHFSMVRERVKVTRIPRLRCFPAQVKHTKEAWATDAQSAQGALQSAQRLIDPDKERKARIKGKERKGKERKGKGREGNTDR